MMRCVILFIILFLSFSCNKDNKDTSDERGNKKLRYCAYGSPLLHTRCKLFEFVAENSSCKEDDDIIIGPVEILGNRGVVESGYEPHASYCKYIHLLSDTTSVPRSLQPLFVQIDNIGGDSLTMLLHYSCTIDNDSVYNVIEGTLYIPIDNRASTPNTLHLEHLPLKNKFTKGSQLITLDIRSCLNF